MFSKRLKSLRKQANLSQKSLADMLFVSQAAVAKWELDKSTPTPEMLVKLADIFDVSTDYLLGQNSIPSAPTVNDDTLKAAFYAGYSDKLSPIEVDELWEDAKEYAQFKAQQRINKKD